MKKVKCENCEGSGKMKLTLNKIVIDRFDCDFCKDIGKVSENEDYDPYSR